jgi:sulfite exporter TauE/SafE
VAVIEILGPVLASSVLGSPHCAGMCGGFVGFYAGQDPGRARPLAHVAYNGGRLVSYLALGALAGMLGAGLDRVGALAGVSRTAGVVAGALMVVWAGAAILAATGLRRASPRAWPALGRPIAAAVRALRDQPPEARALAIGMLSTLLPCGWLYAFAALAAATGGASGGMLVMLAFWAGTVPMMAGLGLLARRALGPLGRRLPLVTASVLLVFGVLTLSGRLQPHTLCHQRSAMPAAPLAGVGGGDARR